MMVGIVGRVRKRLPSECLTHGKNTRYPNKKGIAAMNGFSSNPIATSEQFKNALLALRDKNLPESHFAMLRAQCRAKDSTITSPQLATAAGYENYNAANLQYGTLAFNLASAIAFIPTDRHADGSCCWWTTLSYTMEGHTEEGTGHFQFIMRPELVQALRDMRWA